MENESIATQETLMVATPVVTQKTLTVFTPTYNRAYCLGQCYESLVKQSNQDFIWLIIDDGSTDDTQNLVRSWIKEDRVTIQYHFQENQGMHGGHNSAYDVIATELNVCIDSDDYMPEDAVAQILSCWDTVKDQKDLAGIIGLDAYKNGKVIGKEFPKELDRTTLEDLHHKHQIHGDKKIVYRSEIVNQYPRYPIFDSERFVPLGILYLLIDKKYELACLNQVLCVVEYMEDGSSRNILKQYYRHPKGFQYARIVTMQHSNYLKVQFKNAVHYISHSMQLRDTGFLKKNTTFRANATGFTFRNSTIHLRMVC